MITESAISPSSVRILHLEDNAHDHLLVREMLAAEGFSCDFALARSRPEFEAALERGPYDLIISDFTLPAYDGLEALALVQRSQNPLPFIFFSGTIGEEIAVESLKTGATDYVIKQRPQRLVAAVRRALRETAERSRRARTEAALRQSEERFGIVARATNDVIWEWDLQRKQYWHSENFESVFGHRLAAGALWPEAWAAFIHPEDKERILSGLKTLLAGGGQVWWGEYRFGRADGTYAHVLDRAFIVQGAQAQPVRIVGVTMDMTERKHTEEKIREQAALLDKAHDAIMVCDLEGRIIFWNRGAERIYGWSASEAAGRRVGQLLFNQMPLCFSEARRSVAERGEWLGEFQQITKHEQPVMVQSSWTLVRDTEGRPKSELIINRDITEQRQLEERFLRTQRLESLGALVGGIAHDLNNALVPVLAGAGLLRTMPLPEPAAEILKTMAASARRGADMVQQILTFARGGECRKSVLHVNQLVKEMGKIITDTFPKSIQCRVQTGPDCWPVHGLPTQLHQVIMNLCINARDAMPAGGTLTLDTRNTVIHKAEAAQHRGAAPGRYLCLSVNDTGVGIPQDQLTKIFQPFFTTKAPGHGTGLGLSTSLAIVKNHGGFMTVQSAAGLGTAFKVYLPALEPPGAPEPTPSAAALPAGHGEGVLIVDDEAAILALSKTTLENYRYRVRTAASGPEAVALFNAERNALPLVITDESMPFMDGAATVQALRRINPTVKIILTGGREGRQEMKANRRANADAFIEKPFTIEKLLITVHDVLAKKGSD